MAPSHSHSQSLLPNRHILILDRIERDSDRFRFRVHLEQNRVVPFVARFRGLGTASILDNSRIFRGRVWRSNYGLRSAASAAGIHRAHARSSANGCQASLALTGGKRSEPQKSCDSSATWPEVCPDSDCWLDCPSPPVMTRFCDVCESNRRKHRQCRFTIWVSTIGLGGKAKIMEQSW